MTRPQIRQRCLRLVWIVVGGVFCGAGGPPTSCCGPMEMPPDAQVQGLPEGTNATSMPDSLTIAMRSCG